MKPIYYLLLVFAIVKSYVMLAKFHLLDWDESVYISMARYIYSGGQVGLFEHIRPVGLPLILPFGNILIADMVILLFSLGVIYLTYLLAKDLLGEKTALISALLLAVSPVFYVFSLKIYTGIPTMFFVLLSLVLLRKKMYALTGLAAGFAFIFRFPAGLILPILVYLAKKPKPIIKIVVLFSLMVLPYFVFSFITYGGPLFTLGDAIGHQDNEFFRINGLTQNLLYYPFVLVYPLPVLLLGFGFMFFYKQKLKYLVMPFIIMLAYFTWIVNKQPRFGLMMMPFLAILAGYVILRLCRFRALKYLVYGFTGLSLAYGLISGVIHISSLDSVTPDVMEFYQYEFEGTVLTTDPGPAVYSSAKFLPVYDTVQDAWQGYDEINADMYILYPDVLPCYTADCNVTRSRLFDALSEEELVFSNAGRQVYQIK